MKFTFEIRFEMVFGNGPGEEIAVFGHGREKEGMAVELGEAHVGQGVPAFNHEGVEDETEFERRAVVRDVVDSQGFVIRTTYKCVILPIDAGYSENVAFQGRLMS